MNHRAGIRVLVLLGILLLGFAGCGSAEQASESAEQQQVSSQVEGENPVEEDTPTAAPTQDLTSMFEQAGQGQGGQALDLSKGVTGIGSVKSKHDADLVFTVGGTIQEVLVEEGDKVSEGQLLARLDVRTFDQDIVRSEAGLIRARAQKSALYEQPREADIKAAQAQVRQAEAALALAQAQQSALYEEPREADLHAANAQVRQAEAALARLLALPEDVDVRAAEASLALAQVNLQATRDNLSYAKTRAELQVKQAAYQLTQAQWQYALSQRYWEHADESETDPVQPEVTSPATGQSMENELSEGAQANYLASYEQAKAAMQQAEEAVAQAVVVAESARKAEVTGVQAAEQQVVQAQVGLDRVLQQPNEHDVAQAQAGVDLANANRRRLFPDPNQSQQAQAAAGVAQAQAGVELANANVERLYPDPNESQEVQAEAGIIEAESALELAKLNREYAEMHAPFDGIISEVNIDPGDSALGARDFAVQIVDMDNLHVDVDISDVDISDVQIGANANVYADALPGETFAGEVSYIAPMADVQGNVRTYTVRIELERIKGLRPGMSVRVEIETEE
jgi:HlyD family secretion protein